MCSASNGFAQWEKNGKGHVKGGLVMDDASGLAGDSGGLVWSYIK